MKKYLKNISLISVLVISPLMSKAEVLKVQVNPMMTQSADFTYARGSKEKTETVEPGESHSWENKCQRGERCTITVKFFTKNNQIAECRWAIFDYGKYEVSYSFDAADNKVGICSGGCVPVNTSIYCSWN